MATKRIYQSKRPKQAAPAAASAPASPASAASVAQTLTDWLVLRACRGLPPLHSAHALAAPYQVPDAYPSRAAAARALVHNEMRKAFGTGFVTGLGGLVALPVVMPAGMAMSLVLQARMVAAIAVLYGHDLEHPGVQTSILLSLEAGFAPEGMRRVGQRLGKWAAGRALYKVAPNTLLQINERIGANLLRRVSRNRWGLVGRAVPMIGAVVAGGMDAYGCRQVAHQAVQLFGRAAAWQAEDESLE